MKKGNNDVLPDSCHGGGLVAKSCPTLATLWTVSCQTPPSMGCSRQEYWSELPFPSPGDRPDPGIKPRSPRFFTNRATREAPMIVVPLPEAQKDFRERRNKAGMCRGLYAGVFTRSSRGGGGE